MSKKYYKKWYYSNLEKARADKKRNMRRYRALNPEKYRKQSRDAKARLRNKLLEMYGKVCAICSFSDKRALTLDHVLKNGNKERKRLGERGVYIRAIKNYRPMEYRTLCMNCQFIQRQS